MSRQNKLESFSATLADLTSQKVARMKMTALLRKPQDALQLDKMEIAAKRHKGRKTIQFLCFLCLFAAQDPVFYLAA